MYKNSNWLTLAFAGLTMLASSNLFAQAVVNAANQERTAEQSIRALLEMNRKSQRLLIPQGELNGLIHEDGGGACPSAAALIVYQALRIHAGLDADCQPHKRVLGAFAHDRTLLNGRLDNEQVVKLLGYYEDFLEGRKIKTEVLSAPNSKHAKDGPVWTSQSAADLSKNPEALKILSYTVTQEDGTVLGRHFVLLKKCNGDTIEIVDPNAPNSDRSFIVEPLKDVPARVFLRFPPHLKLPYVNELNTVFTVRLQPVETGRRLIPTEGTPVTEVCARLDDLAIKLRGEGKLLSPTTWRKESTSFGLPALDLPKEVGGANWSTTKMVEVFMHAGRHDLNLRDVVGGAHSRLLLKSKHKEARDILQQMADGNGYMAITITEPTAGSDFTSMKTTCKKVDGGYILNGEKRFNARLEQASHVIVFTQTNTGKQGYLNTFVLPMSTPGLAVKSFKAHGLIGNSYGGLVLNNVFVPDHFLIGEEDGGKDLFNAHFRYWRLMQSAAALGTAERALELMAERLKERHVNGKPIGRFTHLQQPMGQGYTEIQMAKALALQAAALLDEGNTKQADLLVCGLKAEGVEIALRAVDAAARAYGGEGYSDLVDIGDRLRDLQGLRIADGTTDVMRSAVVAKAYGSEFWKMAIEGE